MKEKEIFTQNEINNLKRLAHQEEKRKIDIFLNRSTDIGDYKSEFNFIFFTSLFLLLSLPILALFIIWC